MPDKRENHLLSRRRLGLWNNVRVTPVNDGEDSDPKVLSTSRSEVNVVARVVVDSSLGEHGVVLNLRLAERRTVTRDDNKLGCLSLHGVRFVLAQRRSNSLLPR